MDADPDLIAKIIAVLEALPDRYGTTRAVALRLEPFIRKAVTRGHTIAEMSKLISDLGYPMKATTLRIYMSGKTERRARPPKSPPRLVPPKAAVIVAKVHQPMPLKMKGDIIGDDEL
jgi:hypothetical protein